MGWSKPNLGNQFNKSGANQTGTIIKCNKWQVGTFISPFIFLFSHRSLLLFTVVFFLLSSYGCEQTFQPFKENSRYPFSMYGYLDASADTQWIRITPARRQLQMSPVTPEIQMTLEEQKTGVSIQLNDSLFLQANGFHYLNFWTTMDIRPEHSYQLTATDSAGTSSRVIVTIPEDFPTPEVSYGGSKQCYAVMDTRQVSNLADLHTRWHVRIESTGGIDRTYRIPYRYEIEESGVFAHMAEVEIPRDWEYITSIFSDVDVHDVTIFIASGGPEWSKDVLLLSDITYALPEGLSNVENGLGYVVGILSKSIPYEGTCPIITLNEVE